MKPKVILTLAGLVIIGSILHLSLRKSRGPVPMIANDTVTVEVEVEKGKVLIENQQGKLQIASGEKGRVTSSDAPEHLLPAEPTRTPTPKLASLPFPTPAPIGSVAGRAIDTDGDPIEGCEVIFLLHKAGSQSTVHFTERGFLRLTEPYVVTDASGEFLARRIPAGDNRVAWRAAGYAFAISQEAVEVLPGKTTAGVFQKLEKAGVIEGQVVENITGKPITHAKVSASIISSYYHPENLTSQHKKLSTFTDNDGRFLLDILFQREQYDLVAEHPRYVPGEKKGVDVDTGQLVRFVLMPGGTIEGQVVRRDNRKEVARAKVFAVLKGKVEKEVESATGGHFLFEELKRGNYLFKAQAEEMVTLGKAKNQREISIARQYKPLELELVPGGVIELTVLDKTSDRPITGAEVRLSDFKWHSHVHCKLETKTTDEKGRVRWGGIESVQAYYRIRVKGYPLTYGGPRNKLIVNPGEVLSRTIHLAPGKQIAGRVVDEQSYPIAEAHVGVRGIYDKDGRMKHYGALFSTATTDPDGDFLLEDLPDGRVDIMATKESFAPGKKPKALVGTIDLELVLRPGATLSGLVKSERGEPVPGATVRIDFTDRHEGIEDWLLQHRVESGSDGIWIFEHLEAGTYEVFAQKGRSHSKKEKNIKLSWTDKREGLNLFLKEGATVSGRVVDRRTKQRIEGVELQLWTGNTEAQHIDNKTDTDSNGAFEYVGVPAGNYSLRARKVPKTYIAPGYETLAQFTVGNENIPDIVIELQPGATVRGQVLTPDGHGTEAQLAVHHQDSNRLGLVNQEIVKSDANGVFERTGLPPAKGYRVVAKRSGYGTAFSAPFDLEEGETKEGIIVQLTVPGQISGSIKDEAGSPVTENYYVNAMIGGSYWTGPSQFQQRAAPDDTGFYRIEDLPAGMMTVNLVETVKTGEFTSHSYRQNKEVKVVAGQETSGVNFVIEKKKLEGYIAGRVVDKDGKGVAGIMLNVNAVRQGSGGSREGTSGSAVSGVGGKFRIEGLKEGPFSGFISAHRADTSGVFAQGRIREVICPADDVDVLVKRYGTVTGRVVKKGTGEPVKSFHAAVFVLNYLPEMKPFIDPEGKFFIDRVIPGSATLRVAVEGVGVFEKKFEVDDGEEVKDIVVEVGEPTGIRGRVVRKDDGEPIEGAKVIPISLNRVERWMDRISFDDKGHAVSDTAGEFTITGIAAGMETLYIEHPDYGLTQKTGVVVPEGGMAEGVLIELEQPGALEGHVFKDSKPMEGGKIEVHGLPNALSEKTDETGHYQFPLLPPGAYRVRWNKDERNYRLNPTRTAEVRSGETTVVNFGKGGATLFGVVTHHAEPVESIEVNLLSGVHHRVDAALSNSQGEYRMTHIEAGSYQLSLSKSGKNVYRESIDISGEEETERNFQLPTGSLSGQVTESQSGKRLKNAKVRLIEDAEASGMEYSFLRYEFETQTSGEGEYELKDLPACTYRIMASHSSYGSQATQLTLAEGDNRSGVDFNLYGGGVLRITLKDASNGEPLSGRVTFYNEQLQFVLPGESIGEYRETTLEYKGLPPGRLLAMANAHQPGSQVQRLYAPSRRWVDVEAGATGEVEILCHPGIALRLKVVNTNEEELTGVRFSLIDSAGEDRAYPRSPQSMPPGWFALEEGTYQLTVEKERYRPHRETLIIRLGETRHEKTITLLRDL